MAGVNKVILVGNLGRDPDIRRSAAGNTIVSFSVATSDTWRDKTTGDRMERTEWHNVVVFNENLAKVAEQYLKKGSKVYLSGAMRTREYKDRANIKRRATEVVLENFRGELVLLDSQSSRPPAADSPEAYGTHRGTPAPGAASAAPAALSDIIDDDIPF